MSEKKRKKWRNSASNTFHLKSREKGKLYFEFHPGDVIQSTDEDEEALLERTENIVEHVEKEAEETDEASEPAVKKKR